MCRQHKYTGLTAIIIGLAMLALPTMGATITWDDGASDDNWSSADNWDTANAPGSDDTAQFDGSGDSPATVDSATTVGGLLFNNGQNFTIGGTEALTLGTGGIDVQDGHNYTIEPTLITADINQTWHVVDGGSVDFSYEATKTTITKTGGGKATVAPGNVKKHALYVNEGEVDITAYEERYVPLVAGDESTTKNATVRLSDEIGSRSSPIVRNTGTMVVEDGVTLTSATVEGECLTMSGGTLQINEGGTLKASGSDPLIVYTVTDNGGQAIVEGLGEIEAGGGAADGGPAFDVAENAELDEELIVNTKLTSRSHTNLFKTGAGTLVLEADNDYESQTRVVAGRLLVNGTHSGGGNYTVDNGATLGGNGTIGLSGGNSVTVDGTLAPGTSIGTLAVEGDVAFNDGSTFLVELDGTTTDLLKITGNLDLGSTSILDVSGTANGVTNYTIASFTDGLEGTFDSITGVNENWVQYNDDSIVIIPEPASLALLGLGLVGLLCRRPRRRK